MRFSAQQCRWSSGFFELNGTTVVIGVFIILLGGVLIAVDPLRLLALRRDAQRVDDLMKLREGIERYYDDYGMYPSSSPDYLIVDEEIGEVSWGKAWRIYSDRLPEDPDKGRWYVYWSNPSHRNQSYVVYASLEHPEESELSCNIFGEGCIQVPEGVYCGEEENVCNMGFSSSNTSP